ncbi:hypothetical protein DERF_002788 [Dermatophagoides farinae]|uniref:Uncharacterized protein n=1 Tax=Dermatophagoides farinae TaxID=6954 RepID=A0A922LDE5_DERFA|nr:hypothetical protein DERF_002788 [Dermatophagoides farinae]
MVTKCNDIFLTKQIITSMCHIKESRLGYPSKLKPFKKSISRTASIKAPPSGTSYNFPFSSHRAPDNVFNITPLGFQLNLYKSELSADSGAGIPPQNDLNDVILPPFECTCSKHSIANK